MISENTGNEKIEDNESYGIRTRASVDIRVLVLYYLVMEVTRQEERPKSDALTTRPNSRNF